MSIESEIQALTASIKRLADINESMLKAMSPAVGANKLGSATQEETIKDFKLEPSPKIEPTPIKKTKAPEAVKQIDEVKLEYKDIQVPFLTRLIAKCGRDEGAKFLEQFDLKSLKEAPKEQWNEIKAALDLVLAEKGV